MSAATTILPPQAVYTSEPTYRWTVEQYHELIQKGVLTADDPVELLEGVLVFKLPKNPPHSYCNGRLQRAFESALPVGWCYRSQEPVTLEDGEPEPDGAVVRGAIDDYASAHPVPADIALLIEVADSTLERDRGIKLRSYARAGIVCYWIVNLIDRQIEAYTQPNPTAAERRYQSSQVFKGADALPVSIEGNVITRIAVVDILPA